MYITFCIHLGVLTHSGMSVCPSGPGCLSGAFYPPLPPTHTLLPIPPCRRRAVRSSLELILVVVSRYCVHEGRRCIDAGCYYRHLYVAWSVCVSLSVCLSVCLSVSLSVCQSVCVLQKQRI